MRIPNARLVIGAAVLAAATAAATAAALVAPTAAQAAPSAPTTVTFTLTAGALSITAPATAALGSAAAGGNLSAQLGVVSVSDLRGNLVATWSTTVATTTFVTGGGTASETVPLSAVTYWSGPTTATSGVGVAVPGQATAGVAVSLSTPKTAMAMTVGIGNNGVSWNPTLVIAVPAAAVAGNYTGTVTHSVA